MKLSAALRHKKGPTTFGSVRRILATNASAYGLLERIPNGAGPFRTSGYRRCGLQRPVALFHAGGDALGIKPLLMKQLADPALRDESILDAQVHCRGMQAHASHLAQHAFADAADPKNHVR